MGLVDEVNPVRKILFPEGSEVTVTLRDVPPLRDLDAFDRAAGSWKGAVDIKKLLKNVYAEALLSNRP